MEILRDDQWDLKGRGGVLCGRAVSVGVLLIQQGGGCTLIRTLTSPSLERNFMPCSPFRILDCSRPCRAHPNKL